MKYERVLKDNWKAKWIWAEDEEASKNIWLCFNKTVTVKEVPDELIARVAAENKYWLYINGELAVREGGLKRGATLSGCFFDEVDIAPYIHKGENLISVLVWYWGKEVSYSSSDAGQGGLLFEAESTSISIVSDKSWSVKRNLAFMPDNGNVQPNYRLPESNVYYDARAEITDWNKNGCDLSTWEKASEYAVGGEGRWGETYKREIPQFKDFGLKCYLNSSEYENRFFDAAQSITLRVPYNAQITPYLEVEAKAGSKIVITTENTPIGAVHSTYITSDGVQSFESPAWFNGERISYEIPSGVKVLSLKYRESGYSTEFCGSFECDDSSMNILWKKSLRTLYVTMRDSFMDCPDRERAQWWGDATNEMMMSMYSLDASSYLLYRKGVSTMLSYTDPDTKALQTVVPIKGDYFELPVQQLAGICGFWTYYMYTGDSDLIKEVYSASADYLALWNTGEDGLVEHRSGSWDWLDWGDRIDVRVLENAWYYYALSSVRNMAELLGDRSQVNAADSRMRALYSAYQTLWSGEGYKSSGSEDYDDRGNAIAVLSGLCPKNNYNKIKDLLFCTRNASPYMEYYVLCSLCEMGDFSLAQQRMCERYKEMTDDDYSTLWEVWDKYSGSMNHAWSGGPLVIMSRYIAGIKPLAAGYESVEIAPRYELCRTLSCTVPTVKGIVRASISAAGNQTAVNIECPEDMEVVLHLPECAVVTINGETIFDTEAADSRSELSFDAENNTLHIAKR